MLPQSLLCHLACTFADFLDFGFRLGREQGYGVLYAVCHFGIIVIRTVQHLHSVVNAMLVFQAVHPKSETGKIGGDGRHAESHALQRGIRLKSGHNNAC